MHRSRSWAVGLALAAVVALGGCSVSPLPGGAAPAAADRSGLPAATAPRAYAPVPAGHAGGTIEIGTWQMPTTLSPYFQAQSAATPIDEAIYDGLVGLAPDVSSYGDLAQEVPTVGNGGVRPVGAGMDVIYQLRPGLTWSDGQPVTPDDVVFTYQVITGPGAAAGISQEGYDQVSGVEPTGQNGVVVHFRSLFPAYLSLFPTILPAHRLRSVPAAQLATDAYWTKPDVVSGPFTVRETAADHVTLVRNPHYAAGRAGMPFLGHAAYADQVRFLAFPSRQAVLAAVEAGDVQAALDLTERELPTVARLLGVRVALVPSLSYEQVSLNQASPNPATGGTPPWIGDPAVAQALDLALDRPGVRARMDGAPPLTATPVSPLVSWAYDRSVPAPAYGLGRAKRLLDQDGWTVGPDGVRVKHGVRLAFTISTTAGQQLRATEQDILVAGWRKLGADVRVADFTDAQLFGSYPQGGVLARGLYEAALWSWITTPDPDVEFNILGSSSSPTPDRPNGENYSRCRDPAIDQALTSGRGTLDPAQRAAAYRAFQAAYVQARCELPVYRRLDIGVTASRLHNFTLNPGPPGNTWNLADWWLG